MLVQTFNTKAALTVEEVQLFLFIDPYFQSLKSTVIGQTTWMKIISTYFSLTSF